MQSNYGNFVTVKINNNERIILNSNYNGYCVGIGKLEDIDDTISKHTLRNLDNINNTITYKTHIIKILTKYSKQIDEEFIQVIEEKLNFSNKLNLEKLNNKIDLIQTLENYIYNE